MNYTNITRPQNTTLNGACQELFGGAKTFAEAFEMTEVGQALIQDIEELVASSSEDHSHGDTLKRKVPAEKIKARTTFIQGMHVSGLSIATIHRLTNLMDKIEGWGKVGRKTIQNSLPARGLR